MNTQSTTVDKVHIEQIRITCRTMYDLQLLRIQIGNRIAGNFRAKIGMKTDGMTKEQLDEASQNMLKRLSTAYRRITDGIVEETGSKQLTRLQMERKFKPDDIITEVGELFLLDNYMQTLKNEEQHGKDMERLLQNVPIWTEFLEGVAGCGPTMAGVLVSEIDIHKAEYPSSLWKLAGLDVVQIVRCEYEGKTVQAGLEQINDLPEYTSDEDNIFYKGVKCEVVGVARNNQSYSLVKREYTNKKGEQAIRDSITYNPFLKTKLLGVLGSAFLKVGGMRVDGKAMGAVKRLELAKSIGFTDEGIHDDDVNEAVIQFLRDAGCKVEVSGAKYSTIYNEYRVRLDNHSKHKDLPKIVKHRRALRVMVKQFLVDFYENYRRLEGLPVAKPYAEAKLGLIHGKAK